MLLCIFQFFFTINLYHFYKKKSNKIKIYKRGLLQRHKLEWWVKKLLKLFGQEAFTCNRYTHKPKCRILVTIFDFVGRTVSVAATQL